MKNIHDSLSESFDALVSSFSVACLQVDTSQVQHLVPCTKALDRARCSLGILQHAAYFSSEERYDAFKIDLAGFRGALSRLESLIQKNRADLTDIFGPTVEAYRAVWTEQLALDARRHMISFVPLARATQSLQPSY